MSEEDQGFIARMKEHGYLNLARKVQEHSIPPWPGEVPFWRILVYRIPDEFSANEKVGRIYKPTTTLDLQKNRSPRGIIVSAGLAAMDSLRDHGMKIGDMVWISPNCVYRVETGRNEKGSIEFFFAYVGEIVLNEDIPERLTSGEIKLEREGRNHIYRWRDDLVSSNTEDRKDPPVYSDDI